MIPMLCYKDKTFCHSDCTNTSCWRYLSEHDAERAEQLNLPISMSDFSTDCPDYKEPE